MEGDPPRTTAYRVCMFTYGDSIKSLPPMLNEGISLAAAHFEVESFHLSPISGSSDAEAVAPRFTSRTIRVRARNFFHSIAGQAHPSRVVAVLQYALSYSEYVLKAFARALRSRADVYIGHDLPALLPTLLAAKMRGKPVVYRANELYSETHAHVRFAWFWRLLDRLLVPACDEVVTPDEFRSRVYSEEFGAKRPPLTVRNCPPYRPRVQSTILRDELRRRGVAFSIVVLYQGLIDSMRCIEELAEASRQFQEGTVLVVMGSGFGRWTEAATALASFPRVVVLPRVPYAELPAYTASADVGILLYRNDCRNNYYCAPNKVFEYMMMGLPVIAPSFPGMLALVEGDAIGVCVNPESPAEIAAAVNRVAADDGARAGMSERALLLSRERYNWEYEFQPLLERYRFLCSGEIQRHGQGEGRAAKQSDLTRD